MNKYCNFPYSSIYGAIDIRKHINKLMVAITLIASANSFATQDAETPEQILEMVRKFLSNSIIASEIAAIAEKGCTWTSEVVWFGSGDRVSEGIYTAGGGFTIFYESKSGGKIQRSFAWQGLRSPTGHTISDVQSSKPTASDIDCT